MGPGSKPHSVWPKDTTGAGPSPSRQELSSFSFRATGSRPRPSRLLPHSNNSDLTFLATCSLRRLRKEMEEGGWEETRKLQVPKPCWLTQAT